MVGNVTLLMKFMVFHTSDIIPVSYHELQTGYLLCNGPVQGSGPGKFLENSR